MKENNALRGTGQVFRFSLAQMMKNKANIISLVILLLIALASVPVMTFTTGGGVQKAEVSEIEKVYLENQTGIEIKASDFPGDHGEFAETEFTDEALPEGEITGKQAKVEFTQTEDGSYQIDVVRLGSQVSEEELADLGNLMQEGFERARYNSLGISQEQLGMAFSSWQTESGTLKDYYEGGEESFGARYALQLGYAVVVLMISVMSVSYIVRAVVEEKASKLVEVLMISVKPLALILGKILAVMVFVFGMFLALLAGFGISYWVSGMFLDVSSVSASLAQAGFSWEMLNLSPITVAAVVISLVLGYLTFAILAGLTATGCSSMEDLDGATTVSILLIMAGYILSIMSSASDSQAMTVFVSLCPVVSVFSAPVQYVMGNIGFGTLFAAWILQGAVVAALAALGAKVYENLLMYRGNRLKLSQIISMAGQKNRKEAR